MGIYCLAILLASTVILNIHSSINAGTIRDLSFVTQMSNVMKVDSKRKSGEDLEFDAYFPILVVSIRDFILEIPDGSDDNYLENCLTLVQGEDDKTIKFNYSRECIRKYFHVRKCFTFGPPGGKSVIKMINEGDDSKVDPDFANSIETFKTYVMDKCPVKSLRNGIPITGRMLSGLLKSYVDSIQNKCPPCIEEAVEKMAAFENQILVKEAIELFRKEIMELEAPAEHKDFKTRKQKAELAALDLFLRKSIDDLSGRFHMKLKAEIEAETSIQKEKQCSESRIKCRKVLKEMFQHVEDNMFSGAYTGPEGNRKFQESLNDIHSRFMERNDLGMKKYEVLINFLQERQQDFEEIQMMESFMALTEKIEIKKEDEEKVEKELENLSNKELLNKHASVREKMINKRQEPEANFERLQLMRNKEIERLEKEGFSIIAQKQREGIIKVEVFHRKRQSGVKEKVAELERDLTQLNLEEGSVEVCEEPRAPVKPGFLNKLWRFFKGK